jgi:hypothetical protein
MLAILVVGIIVAVSNVQQSFAPYSKDDYCTDYRMKPFSIAGDTQFHMQQLNEFVKDKYIQDFGGIIFRQSSVLFVEYCTNKTPICENKIEIISGVGLDDFEQRINDFTKSKRVLDILILIWENRTDGYVLYCTLEQAKPTGTQPPVTKEAKPVLAKKELVLTQPLKIDKGEMIGIQAIVKNEQPTKMSFSYIVQIKDEFGSVVYLTWVQNLSVLTDDSITPAIFWFATNKGKYLAEIFLWESVDNPTPLAPVRSVNFEV